LPKVPWTRFLIGLLTTQAILAIALSAYVYSTFCGALPNGSLEKQARYSLLCHSGPGPIMLATVIIESLYQVVLGIDSVRSKNMVQVLGLCLDDMAMLIFIVLAFYAIEEVAAPDNANITDPTAFGNIRGAAAGIIVTVILGTLGLCAVAWKLFGEFQW
jgi:hypothetical protein